MYTYIIYHYYSYINNLQQQFTNEFLCLLYLHCLSTSLLKWSSFHFTLSIVLASLSGSSFSVVEEDPRYGPTNQQASHSQNGSAPGRYGITGGLWREWSSRLNRSGYDSG